MDVKKIAETNDKSMDLAAEIFSPMCDLMIDPEFAKLYVKDLRGAMSYACKHHKEEIKTIMAAIAGVPVEKYVVNPFTLPIEIMSVIGAYTKMTRDLFTSQVQSTEEASSGSAMENTEVVVQPINS